MLDAIFVFFPIFSGAKRPCFFPFFFVYLKNPEKFSSVRQLRLGEDYKITKPDGNCNGHRVQVQLQVSATGWRHSADGGDPNETLFRNNFGRKGCPGKTQNPWKTHDVLLKMNGLKMYFPLKWSFFRDMLILRGVTWQMEIFKHEFENVSTIQNGDFPAGGVTCAGAGHLHLKLW